MKTFIGKYLPQFLGAVLIYSGGYKLAYPGQATFALMSLDWPHWLATPLIPLVTALELYLGAILLLKYDLRWGLFASTLLLFGFSVFLWYLSTLSHPPACGCMGLTGMFKSSKHAAIFGLIRNCGILWALQLSYAHYCGSVPHGEPVVGPSGPVDASLHAAP